MSNPVARRQFLYQSFTGVGGIALLDLLHHDLRGAPGFANPLAPRPPHHTPRAETRNSRTGRPRVPHRDKAPNPFSGIFLKSSPVGC